MTTSSYARSWSTVAIAVTAVGMVAALSSQGLALTSIALVIAGSFGAFVHWGRLEGPVPDLTSALRVGAAIGISVVGCLGLGLWLGYPGWLMVLALAVVSPRDSPP